MPRSQSQPVDPRAREIDLEHESRRVAPREIALAVGVHLRGEPDAWDVDASLDELETLAATAGVEVRGRTWQNLDRPVPATLIGSGKVEEVRQAAEDLDAEVILFDRELNPTQQRNLEKQLDRKVLDRTALILDVFAQHARTREGMLQVELAQLEYRLPRLTRMWTHLARQAGGRAGGAGGGVGLRGPGETQIEIDRREISRRIAFLKAQTEELRDQRSRSRRRRRRAGLPVVALVGYTNAGKSTLLNALAGAEIYAADQLFATLDPTTRRVPLPGGRRALFTDTVGFIQKLPTQLAAAFRATLEEITEADLLLHVIDTTHPDALRQAETVEEVLAEMGMATPPMVVAANKIDALPGGAEAALARFDSGAETKDVAPETAEPGAGQAASDDPEAAPTAEPAPPGDAELVEAPLNDLRELFPDLVPVSARRRLGLDALLAEIERELRDRLVPVSLLVPYAAGEVVNLVHSHGVVETESYEEAGTRLEARVPAYLLGEVEDYRLDDGAEAEASGEEDGATTADAGDDAEDVEADVDAGESRDEGESPAHAGGADAS